MIKYAVEINDFNVYYGKMCALSDINIKIPEGDFLGIIGPNGGGKSTLLKAVLGLVPASSGRIRIFGQELQKSSTTLGYAPQFTTFDKHFPVCVKDTVLMGTLSRKGMIFHRYSPEDKKRAADIMKQLDIYHLSEKRIGSLSGGQLQRVLLARALVGNPSILLLDEPTSSIDTSSRFTIYDILRELNRQITVIVVTHDMSAISSYVKSLACLNTTLHYHGEPELDKETVNKLYSCPVDLIAHGVPHRVLDEHGKEGY